MASISPICIKWKNFISALKSPTYRDFMIKKSLKSKTSKSHTWAPLKGSHSMGDGRIYLKSRRDASFNEDLWNEPSLGWIHPRYCRDIVLSRVVQYNSNRYDFAYNRRCFLDTLKGLISCCKSKKTVSALSAKRGHLFWCGLYATKKLV